MTVPVESPTQIAWVTTDLDATETALTGLLGVRKWVRIPNVHFAPDSCSYHGKPADFVAASKSFSVDLKMRQADAQIIAMKVTGTPTLVVNGKYRLNNQNLPNPDDYIGVVKFLIAKETVQGMAKLMEQRNDFVVRQ